MLRQGNPSTPSTGEQMGVEKYTERIQEQRNPKELLLNKCSLWRTFNEKG